MKLPHVPATEGDPTSSVADAMVYHACVCSCFLPVRVEGVQLSSLCLQWFVRNFVDRAQLQTLQCLAVKSKARPQQQCPSGVCGWFDRLLTAGPSPINLCRTHSSLAQCFSARFPHYAIQRGDVSEGGSHGPWCPHVWFIHVSLHLPAFLSWLPHQHAHAPRSGVRQQPSS